MTAWHLKFLMHKNYNSQKYIEHFEHSHKTLREIHFFINLVTILFEKFRKKACLLYDGFMLSEIISEIMLSEIIIFSAP